MADSLFPITICTHGKSGANEAQTQTAQEHKSPDQSWEATDLRKTVFSKEMPRDDHGEGHHLQVCHIDEHTGSS